MTLAIQVSGGDSNNIMHALHAGVNFGSVELHAMKQVYARQYGRFRFLVMAQKHSLRMAMK
ncbi:hypothetical protein OK016_02285 [Vibrio chagasii]|nr:hypothetical protein [Vibrio chagasii]